VSISFHLRDHKTHLNWLSSKVLSFLYREKCRIYGLFAYDAKVTDYNAMTINLAPLVLSIFVR